MFASDGIEASARIMTVSLPLRSSERNALGKVEGP